MAQQLLKKRKDRDYSAVPLAGLLGGVAGGALPVLGTGLTDAVGLFDKQPPATVMEKALAVPGAVRGVTAPVAGFVGDYIKDAPGGSYANPVLNALGNNPLTTAGAAITAKLQLGNEGRTFARALRDIGATSSVKDIAKLLADAGVKPGARSHTDLARKLLGAAIKADSPYSRVPEVLAKALPPANQAPSSALNRLNAWSRPRSRAESAARQLFQKNITAPYEPRLLPSLPWTKNPAANPAAPGPAVASRFTRSLPFLLGLAADRWGDK